MDFDAVSSGIKSIMYSVISRLFVPSHRVRMKRLALIGSLAKTTADVHWTIIAKNSAKSLGAEALVIGSSPLNPGANPAGLLGLEGRDTEPPTARGGSPLAALGRAKGINDGTGPTHPLARCGCRSPVGRRKLHLLRPGRIPRR